MADLLTEPETIVACIESHLPGGKSFIRDFQDPHRPFSDDSRVHSRLPSGLSQSDWCTIVVGYPKTGKVRYNRKNLDRYRFTRAGKEAVRLVLV